MNTNQSIQYIFKNKIKNEIAIVAPFHDDRHID